MIKFNFVEGDVKRDDFLLAKFVDDLLLAEIFIYLGSLVLEALDGFMFIVRSDGQVDFVSDNVTEFLGFNQTDIRDQSIYSFIHLGDHAR